MFTFFPLFLFFDTWPLTGNNGEAGGESRFAFTTRWGWKGRGWTCLGAFHTPIFCTFVCADTWSEEG